jgi:hypothetical protein
MVSFHASGKSTLCRMWLVYVPWREIRGQSSCYREKMEAQTISTNIWNAILHINALKAYGFARTYSEILIKFGCWRYSYFVAFFCK